MFCSVVIARVLAGLDGVLLGRQTERVEAHRVQHVVAGHPLEAGEDVGADEARAGGRRAGRCPTGTGTCRARTASRRGRRRGRDRRAGPTGSGSRTCRARPTSPASAARCPAPARTCTGTGECQSWWIQCWRSYRPLSLRADRCPAPNRFRTASRAEPRIDRIVVVLSDPFGPRNPIRAPGGTATSSPSTATVDPYRLARSLIRKPASSCKRSTCRRIGRHPFADVAQGGPRGGASAATAPVPVERCEHRARCRSSAGRSRRPSRAGSWR